MRAASRAERRGSTQTCFTFIQRMKSFRAIPETNSAWQAARELFLVFAEATLTDAGGKRLSTKPLAFDLFHLALPAAESRHGGLHVLLLFLIYLTISVRPVISKSTGPIFAKFSGPAAETVWNHFYETQFICRLYIHCISRKQPLLFLVNSCACRLIFTIVSLTDSHENLPCTSGRNSHITFTTLLHYLGKFEI